MLALPPAIPFTVHEIVALGARQNDAVKACDIPSATLADEGEIGFGAEQATVIVAMPVFELSARLVALMVRGFTAGIVAGARKSTDVPLGSAGAMQGLDPDAQIWPMLAFPFAMPFTNQETAPSVLPDKLAAREMRCPGAMVADAGDILTLTLLTIVASAEAVLAPEVTALAVAWIAAGGTPGRSTGAV
jgi:hypothetical protein